MEKTEIPQEKLAGLSPLASLKGPMEGGPIREFCQDFGIKAAAPEKRPGTEFHSILKPVTGA